ncbi:hypothetical protein [Stieleria varia]|uniref:hypothetical protein n=1 Tax=Stieleria varia TaxID=2528005 RepID=UPI0011B359EE|nr:hypothetical protein [Stieleria varia]
MSQDRIHCPHCNDLPHEVYPSRWGKQLVCLLLLQRCWRCARCDAQIIDWCWKRVQENNDPFQRRGNKIDVEDSSS